MGNRRKADLQTSEVGIRFHTVAANIKGTVKQAKATGAKYVLTLTNYFTKHVVTVPLVQTEAKSVAEAIVENWVLQFGVPNVLHADQCKNFGSKLIAEMCKLLKIDKSRTSPYHPDGNGQVERFNRCMADVLSKNSAVCPGDWDELLPYINFANNTSVHKTTNATPFSIEYGKECQYPINLFYPRSDDGNPTTPFVEWLNGQFREAHMHAREFMGQNQKRQKDRFHKKVFGEPYKVEDTVWVFAKHKQKSKKFYNNWEGPCVILKRISEVTYKIAKTTAKTKGEIVHFNNLKSHVDEDSMAKRQLRPRGTVAERDRVENRDPVDDDGADEEEDHEPATRRAPPEISQAWSTQKSKRGGEADNEPYQTTDRS